MSEYLGKPIFIEGTLIRQSPIDRVKSLWLHRQAKMTAKPFTSQFNLNDREENRAFFNFESFLEQIIENHKINPKTAGLIGWAVFQGRDEYNIRNGKIYTKDTDSKEIIIDPLLEGLPLSDNSDLFGASQVKDEIIALRGNYQERVYQIGFLPKKEIKLDRVYQLDISNIFQ